MCSFIVLMPSVRIYNGNSHENKKETHWMRRCVQTFGLYCILLCILYLTVGNAIQTRDARYMGNHLVSADVSHSFYTSASFRRSCRCLSGRGWWCVSVFGWWRSTGFTCWRQSMSKNTECFSWWKRKTCELQYAVCTEYDILCFIQIISTSVSIYNSNVNIGYRYRPTFSYWCIPNSNPELWWRALLKCQ